MGGGDLNMKKSWHPLLIKNQERVWLEERKALAEKKKLDQLKKELEEERHMQELQRLQEEQTGKKRTEKLEWMYSTPATGGSANPNELEDYLLGRKRVDKILSGDENAKLGASHKNFIAVQNANSARDTAAKIRDDPLLAIKQQEQASYQALMSNPLRLKALKERAGIDDNNDRKRERKHRHRRSDDEDRDKPRRHRSRSHSRDKHNDHYSRNSYRYRRRSYSRSPARPRRSASPAPRRDEYESHERRHNVNREDHYRRSRSPDNQTRRFPHRSDDRPRERNISRDGVPSSHAHRSRHSSPPSRSAPRPNSPSHSSRPSLPTEQERARRLAQMSANAEELDSSRTSRLELLRAQEDKERVGEEEKRRKAFKNGGTGDFMRAQSKAVYSGSIGLEERLRRNRGVLVRDVD